MDNKPFMFGIPVEDNHFIGRQAESERLSANFRYGINTILLSPRRWGKTSLVNKVAAMVNCKDIVVVTMDIFSCRNEYDFYNAFSEAVLKQTASRVEEWKDLAKGFIERLVPKISLSLDGQSEYGVSLGITPKTHQPEEVLSLPEIIAGRKGCNIVVCIDEFQQVAEFQNPLTFQKKLRSVWQHQQEVSYCLFGSKRHLMTEIFSDSSNPFYKFGDMIFLKKIPTDEWVPFICRKFSETGKTITEKQAERICEVADDISSYVQHLAWIVWYKAHPVVTNEMVNLSVDELLEQNKVFFQREIEGLTGFQLNFLKALANGVSTGFSKKEVIRKYNMESSANVQGVKKSLQKKDLIDVDGQVVTFNDPIFKLWIKRNIPNL